MEQITEYRVKLFLLKDIQLKDIGDRLGTLLATVLCRDEELKKRHYEYSFKPYVYTYLWPLAKNNVYEKERVYDFTLRVIDQKTKEVIEKYLENEVTDLFKVLLISKRDIFFGRMIESIFSITPLILKNNEGKKGYWRNDHYPMRFFEQKISENLMKKYGQLIGKKVYDVDFISSYELTNRTPIPVDYKGITLLGDKVRIVPKTDKLSQKLVYTALAMGLGDCNATLGGGYVGYNYRKRR